MGAEGGLVRGPPPKPSQRPKAPAERAPTEAKAPVERAPTVAKTKAVLKARGAVPATLRGPPLERKTFVPTLPAVAEGASEDSPPSVEVEVEEPEGFGEEGEGDALLLDSDGDLLSVDKPTWREVAADKASYELCWFTVDSGSAVSGIPQDVATSVPLKAADGVQSYTSASKHGVTVLGKKEPQAFFQDNSSGRIELKVLDPLKKPLLSVAKINKSFRVVLDALDPEGSYLEHKKTGSKIRVYPKQGVFVLPVWLKKGPN